MKDTQKSLQSQINAMREKLQQQAELINQIIEKLNKL